MRTQPNANPHLPPSPPLTTKPKYRVRTGHCVHAVGGATVSDKRDRGTGCRLADDRGDGAPVTEQRLGATGPVRADGPHGQPARHAGGPHIESRLQVCGQPQAFDRRARRAVLPAVPGQGHDGERRVPVRCARSVGGGRAGAACIGIQQ